MMFTEVLQQLDHIMKDYAEKNGKLNLGLTDEQKDKSSKMIASLMLSAYEQGFNNQKLNELKHKKGVPTVIEYQGRRYVLDMERGRAK
jgi:hypothetical protein